MNIIWIYRTVPYQARTINITSKFFYCIVYNFQIHRYYSGEKHSQKELNGNKKKQGRSILKTVARVRVSKKTDHQNPEIHYIHNSIKEKTSIVISS